MQVVLRSLTILAIVLAMVPMAQAGIAAAQPEMVNTGDELVIITNTGRLEARDPYTPPGILPVTWQSADTGFINVATGDFNGDGSHEVAALRNDVVVIYDPVLLPGETDTSHTFPVTPGERWINVTTGDLDGGGADELVLARSAGSGTRMFGLKYTASTGWIETFAGTYGAQWVGLTTGSVMGNGRDQVVGIRNVGVTNQIITYNPANNWQTINEFTRNFPWVSVAVGDVTLDGAGKHEIVVTRSGVGAELPSMYVFRWEGHPTELQDQEREVFNPHFRWTALADVNASGDNELFLLRSGRFSGSNIVALTSRNYGLDGGTPTFNELSGQDKWNGIQAGDVDADGRDEVIVMSPNEYLIYTQPNVNTASLSFPGAYSTLGIFAVGNLDGQGRPDTPVLSVSPLTVNRSVQAGQSAVEPVSITNTGGGTLNWTATVVTGSTWLSVSQPGGTAPATLQLQMNATSLAPDTYTGTVRIDASGATNSPQTITVNLTVTEAPPTLSVSPLTVNLSLQIGQTAVEPVSITNTGGGTLNWTATVVDGSAWLSISPANGAAPSSPQLLIDASGLAPDQYLGRVRIDAPGANSSPQTITVNLTVTAPPTPSLAVTPLTVDLTLQAGQSTTQPINITNAGAGTLNWTATVVDGSAWLSMSQSSGTAPSTPQLLIDASSLTAGPYVGRVRIDAPGASNSPQTITVNLAVTAPQFAVQPGRVNWFYQPPGNPGIRTVTISGQNVSWHAGVVPMSAAAQVEQATAMGRPVKLQDGQLVIGEGANAEEVPIVDWIDVNPASGVATPGGIFVDLSLVLARVPYGLSMAAVVFVADGVASPPALVVRASALRSQPNGEDLFFIPLLVRGP